MDDREEDKAKTTASQDAKEQGLGGTTGGVGGPDEPERQKSGLGGKAEDGPTKDATSKPGGADATGPTPGGVPKEGEVDPDPDTSTGSTE